MSLAGALLIVLFVPLIVLPFLPGAIELKRGRDDAPLRVERDYFRQPRQLAFEFRDGLRPLLAGVADATEIPRHIEVQLSTGELLTVHDNVTIDRYGPRADTVIARGRCTVAKASRLRQLYALGDTHLSSGVKIQGTATDGTLTAEAGCTFERLVDADQDLSVGADCDLGLTASAGRELRLGRGCKFMRLWGMPINVEPAVGDGPAEPRRSSNGRAVGDEVIWGWEQLSVPPETVLERDVVAYSDVVIGSGSSVRGTIKAYGVILLEEGVRVSGNLISRNDVHIAAGAEIGGDVFAEGDVFVGAGTVVGKPTAFKTVYSSGRVTLCQRTSVFGWIVAEAGGQVQ